MPITVIYLQDHEGNKKGTRARILAPVFIRLKRAKIVERVPTTPIDKEVSKPKEPKNVSAKSLKNLLSGGKGKGKKPKK